MSNFDEWERHNFKHLIELYKIWATAAPKFKKDYPTNTYQDFKNFARFAYYHSSKRISPHDSSTIEEVQHIYDDYIMRVE